MQAFVPKNRRPKFQLRLRVIDLNNVPLVSGTAYIKWHLPSSIAAEHRGHTPKAPIKDHKVVWDYEKVLPVRLTVDKSSMLQESEVLFEVLQEYSAGVRSERIVLGQVKLNLAEYVEGNDKDGEDGITRRYLMKDSKINSTLKISISMKQIEGDQTFIAPPLKTAPVFGGIAGIMSTEQTEQDDLGHLPATMTFKSRENGEMEDMYRRTLASSWAAQAGELPADECIENIFAGGSGWGDRDEQNQMPTPREHRDRDDGDGDNSTGSLSEESPQRSTLQLRTQKSNVSDRTAHRSVSSGRRSQSTRAQSGHQRGGTNDTTESGSSSQHSQSGLGITAIKDRRTGKQAVEVDEFAIREDLRSWRLPMTG